MPDGAAPPPLRVIDLTQERAGPYATKLLAGFGADVIKVEPPGTGDVMRTTGPFYKDEAAVEGSIPFLWLNTGKRSVSLNLESDAGSEILRELVSDADVLVEGFPPGSLAGIGLGHDRLLELQPRLVLTAVSNFGQTGPYSDFQAEEIVHYAMSGLMYATGDPDRPPLCGAPAVAQYTAGMTAYVGTLMALYQREDTGRGQVVDVSIQEAALDNVEVAVAEYLHLGKVARRTGDEHALVPWQLLPCGDGYAAVIGGPVRHWLAGAELFDEPRLLDPEYRHMSGRIARRQEVKDLLAPWLDRHDPKEVYHAGQARQLAFSYLATLADVLQSPQLAARAFFDEIDHPVTGRQPYCGAPFRPSATPWQSRRAPLLGEHNEAVYGALGHSPEELAELADRGVV